MFKTKYHAQLIVLFLCTSCGLSTSSSSGSRISALNYGSPHNNSQVEIFSDLLNEEEKKINDLVNKSKDYNPTYMFELLKDINRGFLKYKHLTTNRRFKNLSNLSITPPSS